LWQRLPRPQTPSLIRAPPKKPSRPDSTNQQNKGDHAMMKAASTPEAAKMKAALKAVATELDEATHILHYEGGQPVTTLEGWQIERIFDGLRSVMVQVDEALRERTASKKKAKRLPPDPEAMNNDRAEWAAVALRQFQSATGSDSEDTLADLLGDLMHWADRNAVVFDGELARARMHYEAETAAEDPLPGPAAETAPDDRPPDPVPSRQAGATGLKTYRAEFFTAADYAFRNFAAKTPKQALQLARRFYEQDIGELDFRSNDDNAGLDLIQIWDNKRGTLASWESDEYRLRSAAPELLAALNLILPRYADLARTNEPRIFVA
jgi:hypothetical protein